MKGNPERSEMDTSKEYIGMCRKAVEIQELWSPISGDVYYSQNVKIISIWTYSYPPHEDYNKIFTWLPRQDQLQDIVDNNLKRLCTGFCLFLKQTGDYDYNFTSMEQLWIAFVMHEKYGKKWDGKDWV